jgi:hypothetical protein
LEPDAHAETLRAVRAGLWTLEAIRAWFEARLTVLETLYAKSKLPDVPRKAEIKGLLLDCLDAHYGGLPVDRSFF